MRSTRWLMIPGLCLAMSSVAVAEEVKPPVPAPSQPDPGAPKLLPAKPAPKPSPKSSPKAPPRESPAAPPVPSPKPSAGVSAEVKAGTGVEKREVVGEATTFPAGTTVWVWSRVLGAEGSVKHVWKRDGQVAWTATLNVGSKRWSTQSRRTIPKAGAWEVEVQTADGAPIGTVAFTIQ